MWTIDAYMENGNKSPQETNGMFGYVLRCEGFEDKISFGSCRQTRNGRDLVMLLEILRRCNKCQLLLHTDNKYLIGNLARLDIYKKHDWKNAKGEEIKFREQWEQINKELQGKTLCCQCGTHEFTAWLQTEMRRREQGEKYVR